MSILTKDGKAVPFHGDHHPVSIHEGRKSRNLLNPAEYNLNATTGSTISHDGLITVDSDISVTRYHGWYGLDNLPTGIYTASLISDDLSNNTTLYAIVRDTNDYKHSAKVGHSTTVEHIQGEVFNVWCAISATDADKQYRIQLEYGSQATQYEPYGTVTDPIYEPDVAEESGSSVEFDKTYNDVAEVFVDGKSEQVQLSGMNLFDYSDGVTGQINPAFSVDNDGWISIEIDNTGGTSTAYRNYWTNKSDNLIENTKYKIVLEIAEYEHVGTNASGINVHSQNDSSQSSNVQFSGSRTFDNLWCKAGAVLVEEATTISDFSNINSMMRSFAYANAGSYMRAKFRLSCVPHNTPTDSDSFVYEPYVGGIPSPNPDYPQPIQSVRGANLWNEDTIERSHFLNEAGQSVAASGYGVSEFIKVEPNTTYFISNRGSSRTKFYDKDKQALSNTWDVPISTDMVFVTPGNCEWVRITNNLTTNPLVMFSRGADAKPYIRYGCVSIQARGRNLLDWSDPNSASGLSNISLNDGLLEYDYDGSYRFIGKHVTHLQGKTVTFNYESSGGYVSKDREYFQFNIYYHSSSTKYMQIQKGESFTIPKDSDIHLIVFGIYANNSSESASGHYWIKNPMFEEGTVAHDYEPYHASTATIDLQGHELRSLPDGTKDELRVYRDGRVELVQRVGLLDHTAQVSGIGSVNSNGIAYVTFDTQDEPWGIGSASRKTMSNIGIQDYLWGESKQAGFSYNGNTLFYRWPDTSATAEKAMADMVARGAYCIYPIATSQTIQLPSIDPIKTFYPYTAIYDQDGNDITAMVRVVA